MIVAIDGPAGAGKSSRRPGGRRPARRSATSTRARCTGRSRGSRCTSGVPLDDGAGAGGPRERRTRSSSETAGPSRSRGEDVTTRIREPEIDAAVPVVARHPEVREVMRGRQRELGRAGDSVIEGRDIGVVVVPDAEVKVWLVADPAVRARRRHLERDGLEIDELAEELRRRDERDAVNTHRADDAIEIDTTDLTLAEVVGRIVSLVEGAR